MHITQRATPRGKPLASRLGRHDPRRFDAGKSEGERAQEALPGTQVEVRFHIHIRDVIALWQAAAERLARAGLDMDDIDETIGPVEDPLVDACLATLAIMSGMEGCELTDVGIAHLPAVAPALPAMLAAH